MAAPIHLPVLPTFKPVDPVHLSPRHPQDKVCVGQLMPPLHPAPSHFSSSSNLYYNSYDQHSIKSPSTTLGKDGSFKSEKKGRGRASGPRLDALLSLVWAVVPVLVSVLSVVLLAVALFQSSSPLLSVENVGQGGKELQLTVTSCRARLSLKDDWVFSSLRQISVNCLPALNLIGANIPNFAMFQLPLQPVQSQTVFLVSLIISVLSLAFLLPPWAAFYLRSPAPSFVRRYAGGLYRASGVLAFAAFILTITMGIGYRLLLGTAAYNFNNRVQSALFVDPSLAETANWKATVNEAGFRLIFVACALNAVSVFGTVCSLHNRMHERIELGEKSTLLW